MAELKSVQNLYDRHLFLQAFQQSAAYWNPATDLGSLSSEELILGGRLAARLGGQRLSRWLLMTAHARDPSNPSVRYYTMQVRRRRGHLFDILREFEQEPDLDTDDPRIRASWFAWQAVIWASVRDFSHAHECIERAHSIGAENSWVMSCRSDALGLADRWEEALNAAEESWDLSRGSPHAARCLGNSLIHLGRVEEASRRLVDAAKTGESFEIAELACWHLCALGETLGGAERRQTLDLARSLAEKLAASAPLMDRETRSLFARIQLDIAEQAGDRDGMERWAKEIRSPFFKQIFENLEKNPQGTRVRIPFRRVTQLHDTCLPTSLAAILPTVGVDVDPEEIAREITYAGTPFWAAAKWLEERGLAVRFFTATPEVAKDLLRAGFPFILGFESESSAHAVAAVGFDEAAGTLFIHDPNSFRSHVYLIDFIGENEGPIGPRGMAVSLPGDVERIDRLIPSGDAEAIAALHRHQQENEMGGPSAARKVVLELGERQPHHVVTRYLQAIQMLEDGHAGESLTRFEKLLNEFPGCLRIRNGLLWACDCQGNTALTRETLEGVVERAMLPGIQSGQDWRHPPIHYICRYADLLRRSALTRPKGHRLLKFALGRQWTYPETWHVLADLFWHDREIDHMLLSYRIASCLESTNEHYALSYCDALHEVRREKEGLAWLQARVDRFEASPRAAAPWISWISALENHGHPEQAINACREALQRHGSSSEFLAFAVPFLARMGLWQEAEDGMCQMEKEGHRAFYLEAAVLFHRMRGDLETSIRHCEEWVGESPRSISARQQYLELLSSRDGERVAADLSARWVEENPGHDQLEELHYQRLRAVEANEEQNALLISRVKRNTQDGWAWRELTLRRLADYERADVLRREDLRPLLLKLLAQCHRTAPEDASTLRTRATWFEVRGLWPRAVKAWLRTIDREPSNFYSYRHAWECSPALSDLDRRRVFERMERTLLRCPGRLPIARDMILLVGGRFGLKFAEEAAMRWMDARPDDPDVIDAFASLLLEYGHGRTDGERALTLLGPAVRRFPYHIGLCFGQAHSFRSLGRHEEAEATYAEIVRRHPDNVHARIQLARIHERRGDRETARILLDSAALVAPLDPDVWVSRARFFIRNERFEEARALIKKGLERLPENVHYREMAIELLFECGDDEGAVRTARSALEVHPQGAYLWVLLADTLSRARHFSAPGEVESCLRSALSFNAGLYGAADSLAALLVEQRRYDEAEEIIEQILLRVPDPSWPRGRHAWILRERGREDEAFDEMKAIVAAAPWFRWGWDRIMDWLVEDERWEAARELLAFTPPEVFTDTKFRRRRLLTLAAAGLPQDALDGEWDELLRDFPEDVALHLERYAELRGKSRFAESSTVLKAIQPHAPEDPFVLARFVELLAEDARREEAMDGLLRIWFADVEESTWPARYAWDVSKRAQFEEAVFERARQRLIEGLRPTPEALSLMAEHAMRGETGGNGDPQRGWRAWFPGPGAREVMALLTIVDRAPWADGRYRAILLHYLCHHGYYRQAVWYWKKRSDEAAADVQLWSLIGMALSAIKPKEARKFLGAWRERVGVGMWVIANYSLCFNRRKRKDREIVLESCRDALILLPHDHAAKGLAHILGEMCALQGDVEAFRDTWTRFRAYFTGEVEEGEWLEPQHQHLLQEIPRLGRLLEDNDMDGFRKRCRQLARKRSPSLAWYSNLQSRQAALWAPLILYLSVMLARMLIDVFLRGK